MAKDILTGLNIKGSTGSTFSLQVSGGAGGNLKFQDGKLGINVSGGTPVGNLNILPSNVGQGMLRLEQTAASSTPDVYVDDDGKFLMGTTTALGATNKFELRLPEDLTFGQTKTFTTVLASNTAFGINRGPGIVFSGKYNGGGSLTGLGIINVTKANAVDGDAGGVMRFATRTNGGVMNVNMILTDEGDVGIGTEIPTSKLHVVATGAENGLHIATSGNTNSLVIDDEGQIGIGTAMPSSKLHMVTDSYLFNGTNDQVKLSNNLGDWFNYKDGGGLTINDFNNALGADLGTQDLDTYFLDYNFSSMRTAANPTGTSYLSFDRNLSNSAPFTRMGINTVNTAATTLLQLNLDKFGTNIVANPTVIEILDNYGAHDIDLAGGTYVKTGIKSVLTDSFTTTTTGDGIVRTGWFDAQGGDINQAIYAENGDVIVGNGQVGIGTEIPTSKLHVVATGAENGLHIATSGNTNSLVIEDGGNVGIGTATPLYGLDIQKDTYALNVEGTSPSGGNAFRMVIDQTTARTNAAVAVMSFEGDATNINTSGLQLAMNPLIGGTSPALRIIGTPNGEYGAIFTTKGGSTFLSDLGGTNALNYKSDTGALNVGFIGNANSKLFVYNQNALANVVAFADSTNTKYFRITDAGVASYTGTGVKMGIGTSAPTDNLHISGVTGSTQFRLEQSYTPTGSGDTAGNVGSICWDDNYVYTKTNTGWGRAVLDYVF